MKLGVGYLSLICMALVVCASCRGERAAERLEGVDYVKSLIDDLVVEQSLSPDVIYLVSFSSEPETEDLFAPVVVPLTDEIEHYFIGSLEPYEVGGYRFALWDIDQQEFIPWKEEPASDGYLPPIKESAETAFAVVIATVNGERWPRNHFGYAYTEKEVGFRLHSIYAMSFMLSRALDDMVAETSAISVYDGKGEYFFSHNYSEKPEEDFEFEQLIAYIKYEDVTFVLVFNGPREPRPREEALATKQKLLEALKGAFIL